MDERNAIFVAEAPVLAAAAAQRALAEWGGAPSLITHIIAVSSTGTVIPGIELRVAQQLGLSDSTQRFGLNFAGCFGGLAALRTAEALARNGGRVLLVCVELCTLHFRASARSDNVVANALFADGAAAAIIGTGFCCCCCCCRRRRRCCCCCWCCIVVVSCILLRNQSSSWTCTYVRLCFIARCASASL